jgi:hypothetical protein
MARLFSSSGQVTNGRKIVASCDTLQRYSRKLLTNKKSDRRFKNGFAYANQADGGRCGSGGGVCNMQANKALLSAAILFSIFCLTTPRLDAAEAYPLFTDINVGMQAFGVANASEFGGLFTLNDNATLNGNAILSINQDGQLACCHGALIEVSVSNGENGTTETGPPGHPTMPGGLPTPGVIISILTTPRRQTPFSRPSGTQVGVLRPAT